MKTFFLLLLGCYPIAAQDFDWYSRWDGAGKTWYEKWSNTLKTIEELPMPARIEMLGKAVALGGDMGMSNDKREVFTRAQKLLLAIPDHAQYYQDKIESMRAKVLLDAKKSENEIMDMQDAGQTVADEWTYSSNCEIIFKTLALMPSSETVAVLGHFLNDPEGRDGKTLLGNKRRNPGDDFQPRPINCEGAAKAIRMLAIDHPPFKAPVGREVDGLRPGELDAWKDWWNEVKAGKRTYRFIGSSIEYGPDGPVTKDKLQQIERNRKRDTERTADRRNASSSSGTAPGTENSAAPRPMSIAGILAACALVLAAVWFYVKGQRKSIP